RLQLKRCEDSRIHRARGRRLALVDSARDPTLFADLSVAGRADALKRKSREEESDARPLGRNRTHAACGSRASLCAVALFNYSNRQDACAPTPGFPPGVFLFTKNYVLSVCIIRAFQSITCCRSVFPDFRLTNSASASIF